MMTRFVAALGAVLFSGSAMAAPGVVILGAPASAGDTTITTGGTPQVLFGGVTPTNGYKVSVPESAGSYCWISDSTTTPGLSVSGSFPLPTSGQYSTEPGEKPLGPVYINCPTTGWHVSARRW